MSYSTDPAPPKFNEPKKLHSPDDALPPVQAPSGSFFMQLFFIPLIIVAIIFVTYTMFTWLAHAGTNPQDLVRDLAKLNDASWQKALNLANLLHDPQYDHLKDDTALAKQLTDVLDAELAAGKKDEPRLKLRIFLCRLLGEFRVPEVFPSLINAAVTERDPVDVNVRAAALEAIAVFVQTAGPEKMQSHEELIAALQKASVERSDVETEKRPREELRSRAAFVFGVLGGGPALDRLETLLDDSYSNVRYNAATGLARYGDARAERVLLEMLDPTNVAALDSEKSESEKQNKRVRVLSNGIRAAEQFIKKNPDESARVLASLAKLADADIPQSVRLHAKEIVYQLKP